MLKRLTIAAAVLTAATSGSDAAGAASTCEGIRITEDGRQMSLSPSEVARLRAEHGIHMSDSAVRVSSRGSVSSSSSAFASSSSRGGGTSRATVSDADGRRITLLRDAQGCRIIVDER